MNISRRRVFLIAAVLAAVLAAVVGWVFTLRPGVYLGETFYYRSGDTRYVRSVDQFIERLSGTEFRIVSDGHDETVLCETDGPFLTFTFSDGEAVRGSYTPGTGLFLPDADASSSMLSIVTPDGSMTLPKHSYYCPPLCRIVFGEEEQISRWYINLLGLIFYVLGILFILFPEKSAFYGTRWRYRRSPELSGEGIASMRIAGVIAMLIGIGFLSGVILLLAK